MYSIKQGNTLPVFTATLRDEDGELVDLTTADSITLRWRRALNGESVTEFACTGDAFGGVTYAWLAAETEAMDTGDYEYEIDVVTGADVQTWPTTEEYAKAKVWRRL